MAINDLIMFRKGTATQWSASNPVLASGEPGYDLTNNILKIGDGSSSWSQLSAIAGGGGGATITNYADNRLLTSDGTNSGIVGETNLTFDGALLTSPSGNFTNSLQVGSSSISSNDLLNIITSTNLYLWSNFR